MRFPRSCGTLLHPTSFPGRYGMGDLGYEAKTFIDFLHHTGQTIWQVLPLCPTGYGYSPYTGHSAFAGNPWLISLDLLTEKDLLTPAETETAVLPGTTVADYETAYTRKEELYKKAAGRFYAKASTEELKRIETFKDSNRIWLNDYSLFMACRKAAGQKPWNQWPGEWIQRKPEALANVKKEQQEEIDYQTWLQFEFFTQWNELKTYANARHIRIIGDLPIFVDHNSADVWSNSSCFELDAQGNRTRVAGVPPDYFSESGQLWGNPLYKWEVLREEGFSWWIHRFRQMFNLFDAIRIDHFRGFEAYWELPATEKTAKNGRWVKAPGYELFKTIREQLGPLPIIAEDLGVVTPEVEKLRDAFEFPGMKVLQFAFHSDFTNPYLPHNYSQNCVVYTGTHDNNTAIGWYRFAPEIEKHRFREYTRSNGMDVQWELIRLGILSAADQVLFPLQDCMNLDASHRMNTPGTVGNNWLWRYTPDMLHNVDADRIRKLIKMGNRI